MKSIIGQALHMGDEGHNRNRAGTSLVIRELAPYLVVLDDKNTSTTKTTVQEKIKSVEDTPAKEVEFEIIWFRS